MASYLLPDGRTVSDSMAFKLDGLQYPGNWLRLSTPEQRAELGIIEAPPEPYYDQRFYWGPDLPKDHTQLVEQWTEVIKTTAGTLLAPTDWYITRQSETGLAAPQSVIDRRADIRQRSNDKELLLQATTTTEELAAYVTSPEFNVWEETPEPTSP